CQFSFVRSVGQIRNSFEDLEDLISRRTKLYRKGCPFATRRLLRRCSTITRWRFRGFSGWRWRLLNFRQSCWKEEKPRIEIDLFVGQRSVNSDSLTTDLKLPVIPQQRRRTTIPCEQTIAYTARNRRAEGRKMG